MSNSNTGLNIGGHFVPHLGSALAETPDKIRADQAKGLADIRKSDAYLIEFRPDTEGYAHGPERRVGIAKCPQCGADTKVHQSKAPDGAWGPDMAGRLAMMGWRIGSDGTTFCSGSCEAYYKQKMARHGGEPIAVTRIDDASYQAKRAYATAAPQVTTPAAPPAKAPVSKR